MTIYNLFPLLAGNVRDWTPHLERAASMGFNWIFVNPVQYPGYSGSLYSIKDYFRLNPLIADGDSTTAGKAEFRRLADQAKEMGLKLMVDLVISHTAFDSDLVTEHPEWYLRKKGKVVHPSCIEDGREVVWEDLAQFDHRGTKDKDGLLKYLLGVVEFLIDLGFEGFRCDAAYQIPAATWRRLIREVREKHKGIVFAAETLGCSPEQTLKTARAGFNYIFNSSKWWDFYSPWLFEQYELTRDAVGSISFPESHDTTRLAADYHGHVDSLKRNCFFSALFSTGFMIPIGFEFGFKKKLHVVETRPTDWEQTDIDLTSFITALNRTRSMNPVFQEDAHTIALPCSNHQVLFLWKGASADKQEALIILNRDPFNKQFFRCEDLYRHIQLPGPLIDVSPEYPLNYLPTPYEYDLRPGQGIAMVTPPK